MKDRATRRALTKKVIKRRIKQVKATTWHPDEMLEQPHRMAKKHPFDCGNPKCGLCHLDKLNDKPKISDLKRIPMESYAYDGDDFERGIK